MAHRAPRLPTDLSKSFKKVSGELLNEMNKQTGSLLPAICGSYLNMSPVGNVAIPEQSPIVGVATITAQKGPGKYEAKFRYLAPGADGQGGSWKDSGATISVDANVYSKDGSTAAYSVGSRISMLYDPRSFLFVPLQSPPPGGGDGNVAIYSSSQVRVPRADQNSNVQHDLATIVLERVRQNNYNQPEVFNPALVIHPNHSRGSVTGSIPVIVTVRHYDELRLRCGTSPYSRADMNIVRAGMSIRWLGRVSEKSIALDLFPQYGSGGFYTIPNMLPIAYTESQNGDTPVPTFNTNQGSIDSGNVRFSMPLDPGDEWIAEVTIWAQVDQTNLWAFAKIEQPDAFTPNRAPPTWSEANEKGLHSAVLLQGYDGQEHPNLDMKIWLAFVDRFGVAGHKANKQTIAESGVVYGPVVYSGEEESVDVEPTQDEEGNDVEQPPDKRPIYVTTLTKEEYICSYTGDLKKGEIADFTVLNKDFEPNEPRISINAIAKFNAYKKFCKAVVSRENGVMVANLLECKPS